MINRRGLKQYSSNSYYVLDSIMVNLSFHIVLFFLFYWAYTKVMIEAYEGLDDLNPVFTKKH